MKNAVILLTALLFISCGKPEQGNPKQKDSLLHINNNGAMYISTNPFELGSNLVFELRPEQKEIDNIRLSIQMDHGPSGIKMGDIKLWELSSDNRRVEQTIKVSQAEVVLYERKVVATVQNLDKIAFVRIESSKDFDLPILEGMKIDISVDYYRFWEHEKCGKIKSLVQSDSCRIPVKNY